jgi:hypothetical protein
MIIFSLSYAHILYFPCLNDACISLQNKAKENKTQRYRKNKEKRKTKRKKKHRNTKNKAKKKKHCYFIPGESML